MKRVLVITYYWPPAGGSGVQRWVKFAKYLPSEGWQPVIYTPENPEYMAVDKTLGDEIPPETEILKSRIREPYAAYRALFGKKAPTDMKSLTAAASGGEVTPISSGKKSWKQRLSLWIRGNLFVPDPRVWWVRPSVRKLKKYLRDNPVDVIVTTGPPHSMHLIGQRLHKALDIPWVADFRDPWSKMYYLKHLGMTRRTTARLLRMEKSVLDECSAVLAVTPQVREDFLGMTGTPVYCITNGFDESDFLPSAAPCHSERSEESPRLTIVHTGLLASDGNPLVLWKILGEKAAADPSFREALEIRLIGKTDADVLGSITEAGLGSRVTNPGYLDHLSTVKEQQDASLLILPLRNDPEYKPILPGKLFEYLAARRPVLGIGQPDGAMADVLRETEAGITCDWEDEAGVRAFIDRIWEQWISGGIPATAGDISRYTRRRLTGDLSALLSSLIKEKRNEADK